jgi:hypothetical protein
MNFGDDMKRIVTEVEADLIVILTVIAGRNLLWESFSSKNYTCWQLVTITDDCQHDGVLLLICTRHLT